MSDAGYVRIYRRLLGHHAFRNDGESLAFAWMVIRASWQPVRVRYKGQSVSLQRGQLAVSVRDLAEALDRPKGWVERLLTRLKSGTMIKTHSETGVNVITICNYDDYQADFEDGRTPSRTAGETPAGQAQDTEQRREKGNKEEVEAYASPSSDASVREDLFVDNADGIPPPPPAKPKRPAKGIRTAGVDRPMPTDWEPILTARAGRIVDGWPPGMFERELSKFRNHAADKGRLSKDWQAAFRTWIDNAEEQRTRNGTGQTYRRNPAGGDRGADIRTGFQRACDEDIFGARPDGAGPPAGPAQRQHDGGSGRHHELRLARRSGL